MKILQVSPTNEKCGVSEYNRMLFEHLVKDFNQDVMTIPCESLAIASDYNTHEDRILHLQYVPGLYLDLNLLRHAIMNYKAPVVVTAHHYDVFLENMKDYINKIIVHDIFLADTSDEKISYLVQGCPVFDEIDRFRRNEIRDGLDIPVYASVIASFGFIMKWKRLDYVLSCFAPYFKLDRNLFLLLLHSYHEHDREEGLRIEEAFKRIVETYDIEQQVFISHEFLDQDKINQYLQVSDIGILYADGMIDSKGSSAVSKSYISGRCPVVMSDIPHYSDLYSGSVIVRSGDMRLFLHKTLATLFDKQELNRLEEEQKVNYSRFNFKKFAARHVEIYKEISDGR